MTRMGADPAGWLIDALRTHEDVRTADCALGNPNAVEVVGVCGAKFVVRVDLQLQPSGPAECGRLRGLLANSRASLAHVQAVKKSKGATRAK
jgi:hypothetical protein